MRTAASRSGSSSTRRTIGSDDSIVARVEKASCAVLVLTVDNLGNNRLTQAADDAADPRNCDSCHAKPGPRYFVVRPMFTGLDLSRAERLTPYDWSWDFIDRLRAVTRMKIVLKGIVTREDAELARARGVDGIIVSNHGGRAEDSGRGAIESLREVVDGVGGAMPVLVDSGFRRGTDIFKALALGATAVCIGRRRSSTARRAYRRRQRQRRCDDRRGFAIKQAMDRFGLTGTLRVFGAPGEEQLVSRPYFVRDGYFKDVDVALHDHIGTGFGTVFGLRQYALISAEFTSRAVRTCGDRAVERERRPRCGGIDGHRLGQLREHLEPTERSHGVITNGGDQPNVIPNKAAIWWFFREATAEKTRALFEKAKRIAEGAAIMTDTTYSVNVLSAVWPTRANRTLAEVIQANVEAIGMPQWAEGEQS